MPFILFVSLEYFVFLHILILTKHTARRTQTFTLEIKFEEKDKQRRKHANTHNTEYTTRHVSSAVVASIKYVSEIRWDTWAKE